MDKIEKLIKLNDKLINGGLDKMALDASIDEIEVAMDINTDDQLFNRGIDSLGGRLSSYRSPRYKAFKAILNPHGVTDLKVSGNFHDGWNYKVTGGNNWQITFSSSDSKTPELSTVYGLDIFGLTVDNTSKWVDENVKPNFNDRLKKAYESV